MQNDQFKTDSKKFFKENNFLVLQEIFTPQELSIISNYCIRRAKRFVYLSNVEWPHLRPDDGTLNDNQAPGCYSVYGDSLTDSLIGRVREILEYSTGLSLNEQYSYWRIYGKEAVLKKHKDRDACEISTTMCFAQKGEQDSWPIFLKNDNEEKSHRICLKPGDIMIYRGCDVEHWRDKCEMDYVIQCFFHFTDRNGSFGRRKYDGRPALALPNIFSAYNNE